MNNFKEKKVYVVGPQIEYANFISNHILVDNISDADIVLFTGGEDVTPSYYGCKKHRTTINNIKRDKYELSEFNKIRKDQLAIGICRGSQWLCVMNGGLLVQNCYGHAIFGTHEITNGDMVYSITSTHHQMQYPYNLDDSDYDVLYTSRHGLSDEYSGDKIDYDKIVANGEPEIVLYDKVNMPKCLAIQGHPEYMRKEAPVVLMINRLIDSLL